MVQFPEAVPDAPPDHVEFLKFAHGLVHGPRGQGDLLPQGAFDADLVAGSRIKDAAAAGNIQDRVGDGVSCTRKRDG